MSFLKECHYTHCMDVRMFSCNQWHHKAIGASTRLEHAAEYIFFTLLAQYFWDQSAVCSTPRNTGATQNLKVGQWKMDWALLRLKFLTYLLISCNSFPFWIIKAWLYTQGSMPSILGVNCFSLIKLACCQVLKSKKPFPLSDIFKMVATMALTMQPGSLNG